MAVCFCAGEARASGRDSRLLGPSGSGGQRDPPRRNDEGAGAGPLAAIRRGDARRPRLLAFVCAADARATVGSRETGHPGLSAAAAGLSRHRSRQVAPRGGAVRPEALEGLAAPRLTAARITRRRTLERITDQTAWTRLIRRASNWLARRGSRLAAEAARTVSGGVARGVREGVAALCRRTLSVGVEARGAGALAADGWRGAAALAGGGVPDALRPRREVGRARPGAALHRIIVTELDGGRRGSRRGSHRRRRGVDGGGGRRQPQDA